NAAGGVGEKLYPGEGLGQAAGRVGTQAVAAPLAMAATDVVTSAVGLDTGYGTVGELLRGHPDSALRHAAVQMLTFAAFGLAHEAGRPTPQQEVLLPRVSEGTEPSTA